MAAQGAVVETWTVRKPAVHSAGGLVASQHYAASEVGARVLAGGGNAVDAAVATSFAIGTVEPWMSGLGGGGYMLVYSAAEDRCRAVDFAMRAPAGLDPADYVLDAGGVDSDLFGWPAVVGDRNVSGPYSIAVPGYAAGLGTALERFGTRSLAETLAPAIAMAKEGLLADWYAGLKIASAAPTLSLYEESARTYLPGGFVPSGEWAGPVARIRLGQLSRTLQRLSDAGWQDFYRGSIAADIARDAGALGASLRLGDLQAYQAQVLAADQCQYHNARVFSAPGLTAGPTLRAVLARLQSELQPGGRPDSSAYMAYADALLAAYATRLSRLGDADESRAPSCTTHISVTDKDGNMVALTQTLLSVFGSKVMLPATGILMNNGIMWFDPRPRRPNSLAPGKCPLSNMCPVIAERGDGLRIAIGASGGRRILAAVMQILSFLIDFELDVDSAVHQPRIDVCGTPWVTAYANLNAEICAALSARHDLRQAPHAVYPALFACPNLVTYQSAAGPDHGRQCGGAFVMSPWAKVVGAD